MPMKIEVNPTIRDTRAPKMILEKMSRPRLSVPRRCCRLGLCFGSADPMPLGSSRGSRLASTARRMTRATQPTEIQNAKPSRRMAADGARAVLASPSWTSAGPSSTSPPAGAPAMTPSEVDGIPAGTTSGRDGGLLDGGSGMAGPRVDGGVEEVDEEVDHDEADRDDQDRGLDDPVVASIQRAERGEPGLGPREDGRERG